MAKVINYNEILSEYKAFLKEENKINGGSQKSYHSYIKNFIENSENGFASDFPWNNIKKGDPDKWTSIIFEITLALNKELVKKGLKTDKTIKNRTSSFNKFKDFFYDAGYKFSIPKSDLVIIKQMMVDYNVLDINYSKTELRKKFVSRIKTQDRVRKDVIFSERVFARIFNSSKLKDDYNEIIKNEVNNAKFVVESKGIKKEILLKDIKSIKIDLNKNEKNVTINSKNGSKQFLLTKKGDQYDYQFATDAKDLSLDHVKPIGLIIKEGNSNKVLTENEKLSNILRAQAKNLGLDYQKDFRKVLATSGKNFDNLISTIDINKLFKEYKAIHDQVEIEIMDKKENSSKNDKY